MTSIFTLVIVATLVAGYDFWPSESTNEDHVAISTMKESVNVSSMNITSLGVTKVNEGSEEISYQRDSSVFTAFVLIERIIAEEKVKLLTSGQETHGNNSAPNWHGTAQAGRKCASDVRSVLAAARMRIPWALQMIDAGGKPGSGLLRENLRFVGDFDQCMDVVTGHDFRSRYCTTTATIQKIPDTTFTLPPRFSVGLCFPSSCEAEDVEVFINEYFQSRIDVIARAVQTKCQERHLTFTTKAKFVVCICSIIVALLVVATAYDVFYKRWWLVRIQNQNHDLNEAEPGPSTHPLDNKKKSENAPLHDPKFQKATFYTQNEAEASQKTTSKSSICDQLLLCFSMYTNTANLFAIHQTQDSIDSIHGVKFLGMCQIILFHLHTFAMLSAENQKGFTTESEDNFTFMAVVKAELGVDTFFTLSGVLLAYVVLKQLATKTEVTYKFFANLYFHRIWRLTPPYMLVLMTYVPLNKYFSEGPFWRQGGIENHECKDTWWLNLLYINNLMKDKKMCMEWTWYLSCDMQFYLVSPILFLPLFYYEWKGLVVPFVFLLGNAICAGVITSENDFNPVQGFSYLRAGKLNDYAVIYYNKPYNRIGAFVIGIVTGFLFFKSQFTARLKKSVVALGWISASAIALSVVYGFYNHTTEDNRHSTEVCALYNALHRIAWSISVCWIIFACGHGYGGFVNTFLSWKPMIPLSRLTYCTYLIHPIIIKVYFLAQRKPFYMNTLNMSYAFVGMVTLSFGCAYVVYMAFEAPMTGLERVIKRHLKNRKYTRRLN